MPLLASIGAWLGKMLGEGHKKYMKAYGQSAGYAEQAITAIKVVHSYGMEHIESQNYSKYLGRARQVGVTQAWQNALGISFIFAFLFAFYAYAFSIGSFLILNRHRNGDKFYNGGDVNACLFGIIFGAFSVGGAMPNVKAFVEGKVSGHQIYKTINRVPKIALNDTTKKQLDSAKLKGEIRFENVNFTYPTRPD